MVTDDWDLVEKTNAGDEGAFGILFERHKNKVYGLALKFLRDGSSAEDVVQEVFLRVHAGKAKRSPDARFTTWLYRVTSNLSIDALRRRRWLRLLGQTSQGDEGSPQASAAPNPAQVFEQKERAGSLDRAIARLPESLRFPLLLYSFENLPYREIASILGITEKAVERRLYRAKEALRISLNYHID